MKYFIGKGGCVADKDGRYSLIASKSDVQKKGDLESALISSHVKK